MRIETRRLVLLRHGRTDWNATTRIQGQSDSDLDEVGLAQAAAVAPAIAALEPAVLWSSDLRRAALTADAVAAAAGLRATYDERLREFHLGEAQGLTHDEFAADDPLGFALFRTGDWTEIHGAEHPKAVAERMVAALTDLVGALEPGRTAVAVSHGAAIRTGLVAFLGWPLEVARDLRGLDNCGRAELVETRDGSWSLSSYNVAPPAH